MTVAEEAKRKELFDLVLGWLREELIETLEMIAPKENTEEAPSGR